MHLVIGAGEFLGDSVSRVLAADVPVIELRADADDATLRDAMSAAQVVVNCSLGWSPGRRLRFRKTAPALLQRIVDAARGTRVRRIVQVSTADVYGSGHAGRATETTRPRPVHAFERLKLNEERWLLRSASDLDVVVIRPSRVFGEGEDWILPRLMGSLAATGRVWLPAGGRARQSP